MDKPNKIYFNNNKKVFPDLMDNLSPKNITTVYVS